jgi:outer membrane protein OmpA-like peptidoglycan-associated protein
MNALQSLLLVKGLFLCTLVAACSAPLPPTQSSLGPKLPDPGADKQYQVDFPEQGRGAARYVHITIGEDIARDCGFVRTHFAFDSAELLPQDHLALRGLAECLVRPRFGDVQLSLVGRADGRGNTAYNTGLGLRRAERVKSLLVTAGLAAARIHTSSRGAAGAIGDDVQYSYGYDRRVDAVILGEVHAPR